MKIVEVRRCKDAEVELVDIVSSSDVPIQNWAVSGDRIFVAYLRNLQAEIEIFDFAGKSLGHVPVEAWDTVRLVGGSQDGDEMFLERESFTKPLQTCSYASIKSEIALWASRRVPFDSQRFSQIQAWFPAKDGTQIPMFLVGLREVLVGGPACRHHDLLWRVRCSR